MNGFENINEVRDFFKNDVFATDTTGIEIIEVKDSYAKCVLRVTEAHRNAAGAVMGGAIFTLADFCCAVACNKKGALAVSAQSSISYLNTAKGNILFAETEMLKDGRRTACFKVKVTDELNTLVAEYTSVNIKL